jgi:hypothetical protein
MPDGAPKSGSPEVGVGKKFYSKASNQAGIEETGKIRWLKK